MKNLIITLGLILAINSYAQTFEEFQQQQNGSFKQYKDDLEKEFKAYQKAHDDAFKEFSKELGKKWPKKNGKQEVTTKHKFVEYSKDLNSKKTVNYEKKEINLEVIANSEKEAKEKISKMFKELIKEDVKTAFKKDILEKKISKKLKKTRKTPKSNQKLIADMINKQQKQNMFTKLKKQKLVVVKHKGKFIYKANVKMPSDSTIRKAKAFKSTVMKNANKQKIPPEVIYAIMHSESSFNPMARSHIPAFGLMQIVPRSAGIDSYQYLFKKKRVLSSSYLYTSDKNIMIGSAYLHVLYYRYLKKIKDPQSRLYCAIAAYNTGAGNVAKAFIGNTNINRASSTINSMSSDKVYKTLMRKLPYNETKNYLKKVTDRVSAYNKLLKTTL
ncbi:MAG: transglycosylase SLT domain-containing protein [Campylobacterota bacterium]|nr:transglycosylase SLT domain-containing protein [Campylobacterota bacterium]